MRSQRLEDNRIVALKILKQQGARNKDLAEGSALVNAQPTSIISVRSKPQEDWSSQTLKLISEHKYSQAEAIAYCEFENSKDSYAFFLTLSAIYQDERYFECLDKIESNPELFNTGSSILADLNRIALKMVSTIFVKEYNKIAETSYLI